MNHVAHKDGKPCASSHFNGNHDTPHTLALVNAPIAAKNEMPGTAPEREFTCIKRLCAAHRNWSRSAWVQSVHRMMDAIAIDVVK